MHSFTYLSACTFELPLEPLLTHHLPPLMAMAPHHQSHPLSHHALAVAQDPTPGVPLLSQNPFFRFNDNSLLLSAEMRGHVTHAIQSSWADSTVKHYSSAIKQFIHFCDAEHVPEHLCFPADEFVLCAFAASSLRKHARTTPRNHLSALKAWHITHNLEWKGSSCLRYVLNGIHNHAPRRSRRSPHPPVNSRMLRQLVEGLDISLPLDAAVAACAMVTFWGQCHLGELLLPSSLPLLPTLLPAQSVSKDPCRTLSHVSSISHIRKLTTMARMSSWLINVP